MAQWIEMAIAVALRLSTGLHGWTALAWPGRVHSGIAADAMRVACGLAIGMGIAVALAVGRNAAGRNQ